MFFFFDTFFIAKKVSKNAKPLKVITSHRILSAFHALFRTDFQSDSKHNYTPSDTITVNVRSLNILWHTLYIVIYKFIVVNPEKPLSHLQ